MLKFDLAEVDPFDKLFQWFTVM